MKNTKVNLVIRIEKQEKKEFYLTCKSLGISPMRTTIILIRKFARGSIDALPIIEEYKQYKANDINERTINLIKSRIDGRKAHKLNKEKKNANLQTNLHA